MSRLPAILSSTGLGALAFAGTLHAQTPAPAPPVPAPADPAVAAAPVAFTGNGANLNITPKRLILDRSRRSGTVYIYNQGDEAAAFDITLVDRTMLPDGSIVPVDDAATKPAVKPYADQVKSARDLLQVSPRRVTLAPRQGQTIRLRLAAAAPADTGEYRSHLTITTIPSRDSGMTAEAAAASTNNQLRFQISTLFGLSIPVIARVGAVDARAAIENVRVEQIPPPPGGVGLQPAVILHFDLVRLGASSLYGNLDVRIVGQKRGDPIGLAKGLGVYPEVDRRTVNLALARLPAPGEKLEITYTDDDSSPGKVLAKVAP